MRVSQIMTVTFPNWCAHPSKYLVRDEVHAAVLRPEVDLALEPGAGPHDEAAAVLRAVRGAAPVPRALTVVGRASHPAPCRHKHYFKLQFASTEAILVPQLSYSPISPES